MRARLGLGLSLALCTICSACGGHEPEPKSAAEQVALRTPTPGDELWKSLPAGADLVLELDLARLRANPIAGPLVELVSPPESLRSTDLLHKADAMLVAVYSMGDSARQLILLHGDGLSDLAMPSLSDKSLAVGDPGLVSLAEGLQDSSRSMAEDGELLRLRSLPMPEKASSAALRVVARLGFDARVSIASRLGLSDVPVAMTLWADVVDDLAVVAELQSEDASGAERLERALVALRARLSQMAYLRYLSISPALLRTRVTRSGSSVRLVFVLTPKRLRLVAQKLARELRASKLARPRESQRPATELQP